MPIGTPGWLDLAFSTASTVGKRMVFAIDERETATAGAMTFIAESLPWRIARSGRRTPGVEFS